MMNAWDTKTMNFTRHVKIKNVQINHTHNQYFGGLVAYLIIWCQLWGLLAQAPVSRGQKIGMATMILAKTPYYWFIKPWGWFFSTRTRYQGSYTLENDQLAKHTVIKIKVFRCLFVPYFYWRNKPNAQDWENLLSN
jgi:hypothetical protein